jgi:hypothetical protein
MSASDAGRQQAASANVLRQREGAVSAGADLLAIASSPLVLVAILLLTLAVYAPTLNDWFGGDDFWFLRGAKTTSFGAYLLESFDFRETSHLNEFNRYRPLYPIFWRIQYELFGLNAFAYHAVLVGLHLANTVLVWWIAKHLFKVGWAANLAALIFALHPAYADAVTWLSGGNRTVAAFPALLCVVFFIVYRGASDWRWSWYAASLLSFLAAILLHPSALGFAVVLPLYAAFVDGNPREALRASFWLPYVPFFLAAAGLVGIQGWVRNHLEVDSSFAFGWHQYAVTFSYIGFSFLPVFTHTADAWNEPWRTIAESIQGIASVFTIVASVWLIATRRWAALAVLTSLWLIAALLPDTTLISEVQGRVLYMPGAAFALLVATIVLAVGSALGDRVRVYGAIAAMVAATVLLTSAVLLTLDHSDEVSTGANGDERFAQQLREQVSSIPESGTLYVVDPPRNLYILGKTPLEALVEIYYGKRDVRVVSAESSVAVEQSLGPNDRLVRFSP